MNGKVKVLSFCFAALVSNRAKAADFFCQDGKYHSNAYLVVTMLEKRSADYPSKVLAVNDDQLTVYGGSYEAPQSDIFQTYKFNLGDSSGSQATLTISEKLKIDCHQTRQGCGSSRSIQFPKATTDDFDQPEKKLFNGVLKTDSVTQAYVCHEL